MPFSDRFKKLAMFVGDDWFTRLLLSRLLPKLNDKGYKSYVYSVRRKSLNMQPADKLIEFYLYERKLLEIASNILDKYPIQENASCFSLYGLSKKYGIKIEEVKNVNAADFLEKLRAEGINRALSVRCLQIFKPAFINIFKEGFLWNLHSGALPECKGAMPLFWTILKEKSPKITLHEVETGIDEGNIIGESPFILMPEYSLLEILISDSLIENSMSLILNALEKQNAGLVRPIPQVGGGEYYTYPTEEDINKFKPRLIPSDAIDILVRKVCPQKNTVLSEEIKAACLNYVEQFKKESSRYLGNNGIFSSRRAPASESEKELPSYPKIRCF